MRRLVGPGRRGNAIADHGYHHEAQDFAEAVAFGRPPLAGAVLGRDVVDVIYAAYQAAEEGRRVMLG